MMVVANAWAARDLGMTTAKQKEALSAILSDTLSRVIDFLKFAEAKNAALLAFSSAWIVASANLLTSGHLSGGLLIAFAIALPFFIASALVSIWSFLPRRKLPTFHRDPNQSKNLIYFGDISTFDAAAYKQRVRERYVSEDGPTAESYLDDLAIQVAVNSKIANAKFTFFNIGATCVLFAMLVLAVASARLAYGYILHEWAWL
jgi:Family of unknown function (DUF5706)